jgi:SAM-dependent methyltransferase
VASGEYLTPEQAIDMTYMTRDGGCPPTPFDHPDNPYAAELKDVQNALEIGCGIGRNLPFFMEKTGANFFGIDPNPSMIDNFWKVQDYAKWGDRVHISTSFDEVVQATKFDMVVSTFVLQHFTHRPPPDVMNSSDVTREIMKHTIDGCLWFMLEHMHEDDGWLFRWMAEFDVDPEVYIDAWQGPDMTDRGPHNLLIFREKK